MKFAKTDLANQSELTYTLQYTVGLQTFCQLWSRESIWRRLAIRVDRVLTPSVMYRVWKWSYDLHGLTTKIPEQNVTILPVNVVPIHFIQNV